MSSRSAVDGADQFEAAAADIGDDGAGLVEPEVMGHRAIREPRLGFGVDDFEGDAELGSDPVGEGLAVLRFTDGGGGDGCQAG